MVLTRSCGLTSVSFFWAAALAGQVNRLRQRLREFCYAAEDKEGAKRGRKRREVPVADGFVPLLRWVLSGWEGTQLALALDATTLGTTFVVLAVSVVYRGCAIPVGWVILPAGEPHAWKHEWLRHLRHLRHLRPAIPATMTVIVLADRGRYARWRFVRIVRLGWHPFLRVSARGTFRPEGGTTSTGWIPSRRRRTAAGRGRAPPSGGSRAACAARSWRGTRRAAPTPGSS
ncbi:MAG: hypothetical protein HY332_23175 [Chloroflexi bacterium]|nr:hypothetical protein [Chloroflexota bacterium]